MSININIFNKSLIVTFFIVANFSLLSCSSQTKISCNKIKTIVTELDAKIEPALASNNVEEIEAIAVEFEMTSKILLDTETNDDFLNIATQNLSLTYQEYGEVTRNFLQAFTTKNTEDAIAAKEAVNRLFSQQKQLITEINEYCDKGKAE